ncbi:MAG: AAA family ATPase, partial [Deltaproteobacteria bacterium]|nr:AAA family ATPase [Deltaproteobacteria bacterium]
MRRLDERFVLGRTLGAGAFGTVHEATDLETGERVALKRLTRFDATAILRFKREFRALADVSHPSVARLHELFSVGDEWCFTMELVEGLDIVSAIRGGALVGDQPRDSAVPKAPRDLARMRRLARGLASGVHALHRAGKLHRDLKPSNVIVTDAERVVLLDFGLVADTSPGRSLDESADQPIAGTPAYMSPEQGRGDATGPPSDWYSVGVILFEAMTGRVPFQGGMLEVLDRKQREDPPDPRGLVPDLPDDVASLCHRLLAREPSLRPTGAEVLAALGVSPSERTGITDHDESPWVGRASELSMLDVALSRTRKGSCVVALVHGASGMGKSALLRRFLRSATTSHAALVLESRCHDRETVPYKALDGAVDALTAALRAVRELAETMVPRDALALARVFPVLRRVDALTAPVLRPPPADPVELRRRAFLALRELLSRLADARPVVLAVDDLQWADDDSFDVLEELVRGPDPPAILVLLVAETIDETAPPKLLELRVRLEKLHEARAIELVDMHLEPFSPEEALELSRALRGPDAPEPDEIVRVAAGSPFLVQELARHAGVSAHPDDAPGAVDLRVGATTGAARRVLAWLAVAAVPLPRSLLGDLASHPSATAPTTAREPAGADGLDAALEALSRAGLVVASSDTLAVELSHDRVRRAVLGSLADGALADAHRSLAAALARSGSDDHAALADHYRAIGDLARARRHAELAGDRAFAALAFDEAARRFRDALAMTTGSDATRVRRRLADALACAGRGTAAAQIYAAAAAEATDALEALTLRSLAAQQLLRAGHLDEGLARADALLENLHVSPSGDDDVERATDALRAEIDGAGPEALAARRRVARPERLLEMEVCWSIATGLAGVDPRRGRTLHRRALRTALEVGDAPVLVRALAWESIVSALAGDAPSRARADDLAA